MNNAGVVKKIPIFATVENEVLLGKIAERLVQKSFKKGEELAHEGAPQEQLIFIEKGEVARLKGGKEIDTLGEGEVSGMLHLLDHAPSFASLVAKEDGVAWLLSKKDVDELLQLSDDSLSTHLVRFLSLELRTNSKLLRSLQTKRDPRFSIAFFDSKTYDQASFTSANAERKDIFFIRYFTERLDETSVRLAAGFDAVCVFVNDNASTKVVEQLGEMGISLILLRCAGYNNVDLNACYAQDITVVRVPAYSPYAVAEHAAGLMLTLNRHIHKAYLRTKEGNFALNGLMGFDMYGKTVGVIGTGKIGRVLVNIMRGFGCKVLCFDKYPSNELKGLEGVRYVDNVDELLTNSDIISLHCPYTPETKHLINNDSIGKMKDGVMLINTSRGALVDSSALISGLKSKKIGAAGLDVVEEEGEYVFEDHSGQAIADNMLARLLSFPNVIITGHQAFFTQEAVATIASVTLDNALLFNRDGKKGKAHPNFVVPEY